jgi:hypothetical protein
VKTTPIGNGQNPPAADIFVKSARPWDYMNPALPKYPTYPPDRPTKRRRGTRGRRAEHLTAGPPSR